LISGIREIHFNEIINEIIERANSQNPNLTKNHIQLELDKLFMKNNQNLSILYNLSFLDALAKSFNFKSVSRRCKLEKSKYLNFVVSLLISSKGK
jgi:hypothetical protein